VDLGAGGLTMPISGVVGQIKWAYYMAGAINGYRVERTGQTWTLAGRLVMHDAFKLAQRPLMFVAPHKGGEWRWPILALEIAGDQITARLGRLESVRR
jgi:hypothetical protein